MMARVRYLVLAMLVFIPKMELDNSFQGQSFYLYRSIFFRLCDLNKQEFQDLTVENILSNFILFI